MLKRTLILVTLLFPNVALAGIPWWIQNLKIPARPIFCASLMTTVRATDPIDDLIRSVSEYTRATGEVGLPITLDPELEKTLRAASAANQAPPELRWVTLKGKAEITQALAIEKANREQIRANLRQVLAKANPFHPRHFANTLFLYQGVGSPFMFLITLGAFDELVRGPGPLAQKLGLAGLIGLQWALGNLDLPVRYIKNVWFDGGGLNRAARRFLGENRPTLHWRARMRLGRELLDPLRDSQSVDPRLLVEQNFRDTVPGLARVLVQADRRRRGRVDATIFFDALLYRTEEQIPVMTLITRQKEP